MMKSSNADRNVGLLAALLLCLALFFVAGARAEEAAEPAPDPIAVLDAQTDELGAINRAAEAEPDVDAAELVKLRDRAMTVGTTANDAVALLVPQLAAIDARIAELGEPNEAEAPDVKAQRDRLATDRGDLDSAIKRGRLLAGDAKDTIDRQILAIAEAFNRNTFQLAPSPLSPTLWKDVASASADDRARIIDFTADAGKGFARGLRGTGLFVVAASLGLAIALLYPLRRKLRQIGRRFAIDYAPSTRARRSGLSLWFVVVGTATSTLAFLGLVLGFKWAGALTGDAEALARVMMITASIGSFVVSLGAGLLLVGQSSWRLLPIGDQAARKLRSYPAWTAGLTFAGVGLVEGGKAVGLSEAGTILTNYGVAIVYTGLMTAVLLTLGRIRRSHPEAADREPNLTTTLVTIATILAWVTVAASIAAIAQGYVNLALFLGRQMIWVVIVSATTYLLLVVVDDICTGILSGESRIGRSLHTALGIRKSQISQLGVILSALLRCGVVILAAIALSGPFGAGANALFYQFGDVSEITIGGVNILPRSILKAALVLGIGIALMRAFRHWLDERFLPTTDLDPGARNSVSTIVSYTGIILAGFWSLTALGIGIERIALVVSALSVGIGFGLQAITQNFVSGLILLAERPVKIGDTVRIGTDEGDVRRISVRSTEIQIADRSTLIVPNSELITKTIRNMTLANPLGRIQIAFQAPIDVDVTAIRAALMDLYADHPAVLDEPAPSVFIDGISGGQISFNSFAFVSGPRAVYSTRSALLFSMLERFRKDGIELVAPATA